MSQLSFIIKALIVGSISILLLVVLFMIGGVINKRQNYRAEAVSSVIASHASQQKFAGPVLVVPFVEEEVVTGKNEQGLFETRNQRHDRHWIFYPKTIDITGNIVTSTKKRGIHEVRVYELQGKLKSQFDFMAPKFTDDGVKRTMGKPYLSLMISDVRGLVGDPKLRLSGNALKLEQGAGSHSKYPGVHANIPMLTMGGPVSWAVDMDFALAGTESLSMVPMAENNHVEIKANWPHPSFGGKHSPRSQKISNKDFSAIWDVSSLSTGAQSQYGEQIEPQSLDSLDVELIEPVDIYLISERALDHAFLFIGLTFVSFFMFEVIKQLAIHPIQYLLVGMSLAIFFLLLISLSEKIEFLSAYLVASVSSIGLLFVYLSSVLKSYLRGLSFSVMLTVLYAALYGLLVSEDNALAMGSILLFGIIAVIMIVTRKIDWYNLGKKDPPPMPQ
jgi:inner membrane protein